MDLIIELGKILGFLLLIFVGIVVVVITGFGMALLFWNVIGWVVWGDWMFPVTTRMVCVWIVSVIASLAGLVWWASDEMITSRRIF